MSLWFKELLVDEAYHLVTGNPLVNHAGKRVPKSTLVATSDSTPRPQFWKDWNPTLTDLPQSHPYTALLSSPSSDFSPMSLDTQDWSPEASQPPRCSLEEVLRCLVDIPSEPASLDRLDKIQQSVESLEGVVEYGK
jgi:hypothetical protein